MLIRIHSKYVHLLKLVQTTYFQALYFRQADKKNLWNTVFDLRKIEYRDLQLVLGMKTEVHMISKLFGKVAVNFVFENPKDTVLQRLAKISTTGPKTFIFFTKILLVLPRINDLLALVLVNIT
ncbi:hypothetical protein EDC96DRAFT_545083 [Choanephora cucurbitarum]|nr:hypothetical protein EDC96DRAFT_545083 [Choanephora cucurbitarum]